MRLQIIGYSYNDEPITYQVIWVPPTDVVLDIATWPDISVFRNKERNK